MAIATSVSGCHIHNTMPPGPPPPPPASGASMLPVPTGSLPTTDATTTFNVLSGGALVPLSSMGIGGTLQYASNNAFSNTGTFTLTTTGPTSGLASNVPNALVYFEVQLPSAITFVPPFTISPVVFPTSFSTSGMTFTETLYDQNSDTQIGSTVRGTVSGQSVTFTPGSGSFTTKANDVYVAVVTGA